MRKRAIFLKPRTYAKLSLDQFCGHAQSAQLKNQGLANTAVKRLPVTRANFPRIGKDSKNEKFTKNKLKVS